MPKQTEALGTRMSGVHLTKHAHSCLSFFPQIVALPTERESFKMDEYDPRAKGTEKVFKTIFPTTVFN